jgi:hypothetical protein
MIRDKFIEIISTRESQMVIGLGILILIGIALNK